MSNYFAMNSSQGLLGSFALVLISTMFLATPTEPIKVEGCVNLVLKTVNKCYLEPMKPKDCSKKSGFKNLLNIGKKKKSSASLLDGLDKLCNECKGCEKDAKACVMTRLGVGSLKQCDFAQKVLAGLGGKKSGKSTASQPVCMRLPFMVAIFSILYISFLN